MPPRLFAFPGVAHVLVAENVVTVGKDSGVSWSALKPGIGTVIRAQLVTGVPAILEAPRTAGAGGHHAEIIPIEGDSYRRRDAELTHKSRRSPK